MERNKLLELRNIIEDIQNLGLNEEIIARLDIILNENHIPFVVRNTTLKPASFMPNYKMILVNLKKSVEWVKQMVDSSMEYFPVCNKELLKAYLIVYMYRHEIKHTNQYCIGMGLKEPKYEYQKQAYHDIFDIMIPKHYILPRPITTMKDFIRFTRYNQNAYDYILERNASVEGFDLPASIAHIVGEKEIEDYMIASRNTYLLLGYIDNNYGALKNTYDGLFMKKQYQKLIIPDLSLMERVREGLTIKDDERKLVLSVLKDNIHFQK